MPKIDELELHYNLFTALHLEDLDKVKFPSIIFRQGCCACDDLLPPPITLVFKSSIKCLSFWIFIGPRSDNSLLILVTN